MKKTIIASILLSVLLAGVSAGATTCLCVGYSNSKVCGNGGAGGSFLQVASPRSTSLQYFLKTTALQAQLSASGKSYDSITGWFCWNDPLK